VRDALYARAAVARCCWVLALAFVLGAFAFAAGSGSITGTISDPSGSVIPGANVSLTNVALAVRYKAVSNTQGFFVFANIPPGTYDLTIDASGFKTFQESGLVIDTDSALREDAKLQLGESNQTLKVTAAADASQTQVDTIATHLGEVVSASQMSALPLNGRAYTDLLAVQPGVTPVTTLTPTSVIMAGVTGTINPSGDLDPGDVSIDGQRESSNGFMVNGVDVQEHMNGGTSVIPNLDSIQEFRVLTNNFDPEYGNYNGGMVNVVTKSGSDHFHGNVFEFFRNTDFDARNYFATSRPIFRQNQFGGTLGGPIKKQSVFFFVDYQGTRTDRGITSPLTAVPSLSDRVGNLSDLAMSLTGSVSGSALASLLDSQLGYPTGTLRQGERYYFAGCASPSQCVLPTLKVPRSEWATPAQHLLQYIPSPSQAGNLFSTSAFAQTVRDDKAAGRVDANTKWGQIAGYYFIDNYRLDDPYPSQQGGASIPGFDALTIGQAQMFSIGDTKLIAGSTVNEFRAGLLRNANNIGKPHGGLGVSLASQGFRTGAGTAGITVQAPQYEGVMNISFPSFVMGVPVTNVDQWNNTLYFGDSVSRIVGAHSLKFGGQFHFDQVNEHPNATFNGTFNILGTETGSAFADFLLGVPSNFTQSTGSPFYLRNRYSGLFAEDSWHARNNLTVNYGVRWDVIMPWWEKYNNLQTVIPGAQSSLYPGAPAGFVVAGDPGVPSTISPAKYHNLAPRLGIAYSPNAEHGLLRLIFGSNQQSSIRASYGLFYTAFPGLSAGIMYAVPPFGYNYLSPAPPLFATPFINAADGVENTNPFPLAFPSHRVSAKHPDTSFNWSSVTPISADPYFYYRNVVPYTENFMFSFERSITPSALLTLSYVGNQGHHLLALLPTNVGNPALCLRLSQVGEVAPGSAACGPYGEDNTYTSASGAVYHGTRQGLGANFGNVTAQRTIANSNYNALETDLRINSRGGSVLLGYTYSKSIGQGSNLGEELNPLDPRLSRSLSSWDMTHNFVASYRYSLPFDRFWRSNRFTTGWSLSGTTRFSTGFPVTLFDYSDNSLLGTLGNGVNNLLLDTPQFTPGPLDINTNPRNGRPEFNTSLFHTETLGQLGNSRRRIFFGPGISNFDMELTKSIPLAEAKSVDIRIEAFNVFNHAQFYGPSSVGGVVGEATFGKVVGAADPRLLQLAAKFNF
jgi:hypothetical protein